MTNVQDLIVLATVTTNNTKFKPLAWYLNFISGLLGVEPDTVFGRTMQLAFILAFASPIVITLILVVLLIQKRLNKDRFIKKEYLVKTLKISAVICAASWVLLFYILDFTN